MRRNLRFQFVLTLFTIMTMAGLMSSVITSFLLNGRVGENTIENQRAIADMMIDLAENTSYPTDKIIEISARDPYGIEKVRLQIPNDVQFIRGNFFSSINTLVRIREDTVRIYVKPSESVSAFVFVGILATAMVSVILGTCIAGAISVKSLRPINDLSGALERVAGGDFTARVAVPQYKGMRRLALSFNKMAKDLSGLDSLRTDFVNSVSHEFKTPLSSINGFARLLQNPDLPEEERQEYAQIIAEESRRLAGLASVLVNLSRLENQSIVTGQTTFSLDEQLRQAVAMLEPSWSQKALDVQVELDPVNYYGSEDLLRHVWDNLLDNAIKFTEPGGAILVRLIDAEDEAFVRVKDTGIGMTDAVLLHAFEKFYQGDASHSRDGAGLGLPLARRIVELSGGEITVKSEPGEGSLFSVRLPVMGKMKERKS